MSGETFFNNSLAKKKSFENLFPVQVLYFSKNWSGLSTLSVPKLSLVRHCKVHKDVFGGRSYCRDLYTVYEVCGKLRYGHCPDIDFFVCLVSVGSKAGAQRNTPMQ